MITDIVCEALFKLQIYTDHVTSNFTIIVIMTPDGNLYYDILQSTVRLNNTF